MVVSFPGLDEEQIDAMLDGLTAELSDDDITEQEPAPAALATPRPRSVALERDSHGQITGFTVRE
jgi:hypothetical protein